MPCLILFTIICTHERSHFVYNHLVIEPSFTSIVHYLRLNVMQCVTLFNLLQFFFSKHVFIIILRSKNLFIRSVSYDYLRSGGRVASQGL